ncbi:hydrolase [Actinoplanes sp. NPDC049548]|uniref:alpha/beta hydrolase family protein n=1 Tax=Actinoplanes sp. NPDC049548 TaxID=3155152 RepID=UPI003429BE78
MTMTPRIPKGSSIRSFRRLVLLVGVMLCTTVGLTGVAPAYADLAPTATGAAQALRPTLPPPNGEHRIGVVPLHLVDRSRTDPWVPSHPVRELMVSLWYPAQRGHARPLAPWLPPGAWARFEQDNGVPPGVLAVPLTHGRTNAPVDRLRGGRPVVLYSPGLGGTRDSNTVLVEELVSRGYVVATIDHTHDSSPVEFPDGRVEVGALTPDVAAQAVAVRVADTRFVLDTLSALNAGSNPDAEHRPLPNRLRGALDLSKVGMFGHSLGGATAAEAMFEDRRIKAGVNLDGTLFGPVVAAGLDRPFMLVGAQQHDRGTDPTWAQFWANLRGWRLNLRLVNSAHNSFTDIQVLLPQIAGVLNFPPDVVQQLIGTIDPQRSIINQRAYVTAFFDLHLRHQDRHLLDHPSPRFPEMQFLP